jgi:hypothetical protein
LFTDSSSENHKSNLRGIFAEEELNKGDFMESSQELYQKHKKQALRPDRKAGKNQKTQCWQQVGSAETG